MPIKDKSKYPANWQEIRETILEREQNKCRFCQVANYALGFRKDGEFYSIDEANNNGAKLIKIVLTIAHLDHDTANNDFSNLAALCQKCHLAHDLQFHKVNAAITRRNKKVKTGQIELFS